MQAKVREGSPGGRNGTMGDRICERHVLVQWCAISEFSWSQKCSGL